MGEIADAFARIPGETPIDPSRLRRSARWIKNRRQLNRAEAEAIALVFGQYLVGKSRALALAKFDARWSCNLHKKMFGRTWTWAGQRRKIDLQGVGSRWYNVEPELYELLDDLKVWPSSVMDVIEQAATLHHRTTLIHPFENGNGRWARLMANIWLRKNGRGIVLWPDDRLVGCESPEREEYIAALKAADAGDISELLQMHKRHLQPQD